MISQIVAVLSIASMADARMQSFLMVKGGNSVSLKEKRAGVDKPEKVGKVLWESNTKIKKQWFDRTLILTGTELYLEKEGKINEGKKISCSDIEEVVPKTGNDIRNMVAKIQPFRFTIRLKSGEKWIIACKMSEGSPSEEVEDWIKKIQQCMKENEKGFDNLGFDSDYAEVGSGRAEGGSGGAEVGSGRAEVGSGRGLDVVKKGIKILDQNVEKLERSDQAIEASGDNGCIKHENNHCRMTLNYLSSVNGTKEPKRKEYFINFYYPGDSRLRGEWVTFTKTAKDQHFIAPQGQATFSVERKKWVGIVIKTPGDEFTSDEYYARLEYPCMEPGQDKSIILTETVHAAAEKRKQIVEEKKLIDALNMPIDLLEQQAKKLKALQKQAKENAIPYVDSSTPLLGDNSARLNNDDVIFRISYTCS